MLKHAKTYWVVSKRFAKKQQMQWTPRGVHLLMQLRTRVLDGTLEYDFKRWKQERIEQTRGPLGLSAKYPVNFH